MSDPIFGETLDFLAISASASRLGGDVILAEVGPNTGFGFKPVVESPAGGAATLFVEVIGVVTDDFRGQRRLKGGSIFVRFHGSS